MAPSGIFYLPRVAVAEMGAASAAPRVAMEAPSILTRESPTPALMETPVTLSWPTVGLEAPDTPSLDLRGLLVAAVQAVAPAALPQPMAHSWGSRGTGCSPGQDRCIGNILVRRA